MRQCTMPPALDAVELAMYNAGDAEPATANHLAQCDFCRAQAEALAYMEGALAAQLYRVDCPDADALREYHFGLLAAESMEAVSHHLHTCPHCLRELARLAEYLTDENEVEFLSPTSRGVPRESLRIADAWQNYVRAIAAQWLPRTGAGLAPAVGAVRGGVADDFAMYQAGGLQIGLQTQAAQRPDGLHSLLGVVWADDPAGWEAHLWQAGRLHATCAVDELGGFRFSGVQDAPYEVILMGPDLVTRIESPPQA